MATDSELHDLLEKLKQPTNEPLKSDEIAALRRVVRVLEAFAVLGGVGKGLLVVAAGIAALILYGNSLLAFLRGGVAS